MTFFFCMSNSFVLFEGGKEQAHELGLFFISLVIFFISSLKSSCPR